MIFFQLFSNDPKIVTRAAGEYLFRSGDHGDRMYVLTVGSAEVVVADTVLESLEPGAIIGETSVIEPGPHMAAVRALSDCEFVEIDAARFEFLVAQMPHFATSVLKSTTRRLRAMDRRLAASVPPPAPLATPGSQPSAN
ncbi:MAG: cyclic nucleotide-binding domain-containing protein [Rhodocyclaceae bacterium]|nr:cyclic nucleotide-binding domain-containing protein [Rhodocyclaceae bacterium]